MNRIFLLIVTMLIVGIAADASAQRWEITPFGGYRWGGTLDDGWATDDPQRTIDLVFDSGPNYGLILGFFVKPKYEIEVFVDRQHTTLKAVNDVYSLEENERQLRVVQRRC